MKNFEINSPQYINHKKKEANYMRILSLIINDVKNVRIFLPTLADLQLSKDSSYLILFINFKNNENKALELINNAKGFIRSELSRSINTKHTPKISFKLDTSSKNGRNIDNILKKLRDENEL